MGAEPAVLYESGAEGIGTITFNRPEKLNAMSRDISAGAAEAFATAFADLAVRVIILKGSGRAFCAGADLSPSSAVVQGPESVADDAGRIADGVERWLSVWHGPKPVIAQVHGYCIGGGTHLASFCDLVVVADNAVIGWPKLPVGGGFISPVWMWFVGARKAKELSFIVGNTMSGAEAKELGWANHSVPEAELGAFTTNLARRIALLPADLLRIKKEAINRSFDSQGFSNSVRMTGSWDAIAHAAPSVDHLRGKIREVGMREAINWFEQGGLNRELSEARTVR